MLAEVEQSGAAWHAGRRGRGRGPPPPGGRGPAPQGRGGPPGRGPGRGHGETPAPRAPPVPVPAEDFNFEEGIQKFNKEVRAHACPHLHWVVPGRNCHTLTLIGAFCGKIGI